LFEVEILVDNADGMLRPGMVCTAEVVVDRISAYRVPESAVMFRSVDGKLNKFLFELAPQECEVQAMFWSVGREQAMVAQRVDLPAVIDQGRHLLVPSADIKLERVVVRGQQRLSDGKLVRMAAEALGASEAKGASPAISRAATNSDDS
jgi:hypothetical protein